VKSLSVSIRSRNRKDFSLLEEEIKGRRAKTKDSSSFFSMAETGGDQRRTFQDFVTPGVQGISSSITWPTVEPNNFELKPTLIC